MLNYISEMANQCEAGKHGYFSCFFVSYDFIALLFEVALLIILVPITLKLLEERKQRSLNVRISEDINNILGYAIGLADRLRFERKIKGDRYSLAYDDGTVVENDQVILMKERIPHTINLINTYSHNINLTHLDFFQEFFDFCNDIQHTFDEIEANNWKHLSKFERDRALHLIKSFASVCKQSKFMKKYLPLSLKSNPRWE